VGLTVIGTGLGRIGTASLKLALEQLGFGPCHHMKEVLDHPESVPLWVDALEGKPDWEAIFSGYRSAVDGPTCKVNARVAWSGVGVDLRTNSPAPKDVQRAVRAVLDDSTYRTRAAACGFFARAKSNALPDIGES
jgi:hypothetical protein